MMYLHIAKALSKLARLKLFYVLLLWKESGYKIFEINPSEVRGFIKFGYFD